MTYLELIVTHKHEHEHETVDVNIGLDFILSHLEEPFFPRNVMTKKLGFQIEAPNGEAAIGYFSHADYQDCRISAYPNLPAFGDAELIRRKSPSLIPIDLDKSILGSLDKLNQVLQSTLERIYELLGIRPTVLWTGNGYHIYIPISAFPIEESKLFVGVGVDNNSIPNSNPGSDPNTKFLRFAQSLFTDNNNDPNHRPSINSCLLRVPGTYNSKNGEQVKIIQRWDGIRPSIDCIIKRFRTSLIEEELERLKAHNSAKSFRRNDKNNKNSIRWIEVLLNTPIPDYRKRCIWRIFAPYFANVKYMTCEEAVPIVRNWLSECNELCTLKGYPTYGFNYYLNNARQVGYYPISFKNLEKEIPLLHQQIESKMKLLKPKLYPKGVRKRWKN